MDAIEINGARYYTCDTFARLTNKHINTIFTFIDRGNAIRPLRTINVGGKPLILADELTEYPFTKRGPHSCNRVYHYLADGTKKDCPICSKAGRQASGHK